MKTNNIIQFFALLTAVSARPTPSNRVNRREVPQEHSHEQFITTVRASLALNNPAGIEDPVFGLLGDAVCIYSILYGYGPKQLSLAKTFLEPSMCPTYAD